MHRQYHPIGLHRPARLTNSGRPEGVLSVGDFTRIAGELHIIEAFLPRAIDVAERSTGRRGECQTCWHRRYLVHGMDEVMLRSLRTGRRRIVTDTAMVNEYRYNREQAPRPVGRAGRRRMAKCHAA
jgi:hypothetical protein